MKKIKRVIVLLLLILLFSVTFSGMLKSYAVPPAEQPGGGSTGNIKGFNGTIAGDQTVTDSKNALVKIVSTVLNLVRIVGIAIAFIMLVVVACKYIIASAGDRADIKKYAYNYIVGALILFGSAGIVTLIRNFVLSNFEEPQGGTPPTSFPSGSGPVPMDR